MNKNLFLRLYLIMIALLSFQSCRQDILPEQETYNNSSAFQLTSKRISLNESKHKGKLVSEIKQAEDKLKTFSHTNALGKIVNYGNGVSIDTESVIYIENGPNYHTYTFHITKANAPSDAPIENLVLTPLPDGTYKELLVTYNLTPAEKLQAENGIPINTHGKAQITELAKGTYNNGNLQGKTITGVTCGWTEEVQFTVCDGGDHHSNGEATDEMGGPCHADNPSLPYLVAVYKCNWIYGTDPFSSSGPGATVDQPGGNPGAGAPISGTCPDNGVLTAPIDPTSSTNMECESGVPTQINVPVINDTPCAKIKKQRNDPEFSQRIDTLKTNLNLKKETGYTQRTNGAYTYENNANATDEKNTLSLPNPFHPEYKDIIAYFHTHVKDFWYTDVNGEYRPKNGIKMFSPADINYFMKMIKNGQDAGRPLGDVFAVMVSPKGNYQIRFTGNTNQIKVFTDSQIKALDTSFQDFMKWNKDDPKKLEFGVLKFMDDNMNLKGVSLYRMNADGSNTEVKLNAAKTDREEFNCIAKI
jgi:hypothetical protein